MACKKCCLKALEKRLDGVEGTLSTVLHTVEENKRLLAMVAADVRTLLELHQKVTGIAVVPNEPTPRPV